MLSNCCLVVCHFDLNHAINDHLFYGLQIEAAVEEKSRNERLGADVGILPDSELFFIDKVSTERTTWWMGLIVLLMMRVVSHNLTRTLSHRRKVAQLMRSPQVGLPRVKGKKCCRAKQSLMQHIRLVQ